MKSNKFIYPIIAIIIVGALINFAGILVATLFTGGSIGALATLFVLLATSVGNWFLMVGSLRQHFKKKAEDDLVAEIEADQPRRFDDVNFR